MNRRDNEEAPDGIFGAAVRLPAACLPFALFAFLLYMPLGEWANDARIKRGMEAAIGEERSAFRAEFDGAPPLAPKTWRYYYFYGHALLLNKAPGEAAEQLKKAEAPRPHNLLIPRRLKGALTFGNGADGKDPRRRERKLAELDIE